MDRRTFVSSITSISIVGLAGCSAVGNDIEAVEYEDKMLVASLEDEHDVSVLEVLAEDDSRVYSTDVGTETRVELFDVTSGPRSFTDDGIDDPIQTFTVRGVDSEEESVGDVEIEYDPDLQIEDLEIDLSEAQIEYTVTNAGEGPIEVDPTVRFEQKGVPVQVDTTVPVQAGTTNHTAPEFPHPYQTDFDEAHWSDDTAFVLSSGESEQITLEDEPIIGIDADFPDNVVVGGHPGEIIQDVEVDEPIESDTVPLDTEEITIELIIESSAEPQEATKDFVADVVFSDTTVHRNEGTDIPTRGYHYQMKVIPENAEVASFGPAE